MALLEIKALQAGYGGLPVLHGAGLMVEAGGVTALFGPNGAGKSTLAKAVLGLLPVSGGDILYHGETLTHLSVEARAKHGIAYVPQEQNTFPNLTVEDNLNVSLIGKSRIEKRHATEHAFGMFPKLAERRNQMASTLSGGERQMLALASVVALQPTFLIVDEPTSGLAPVIVDGLVQQTLQIASEGTTILWIIGDDSEKILPFANCAYFLNSGVIDGHWADTTELTSAKMADLFFGTHDEKVTQ